MRFTGHEPYRILVIDDLADIGHLFRAVLQREKGVSMEITVEIDANRARELVDREPFDLIVSDYRMRGPNGLEILAAAKARNPHGLRVLMSGYQPLPASQADVDAAQLDAYLQKPLRLQDMSSVAKLLPRREGPDA